MSQRCYQPTLGTRTVTRPTRVPTCAVSIKVGRANGSLPSGCSLSRQLLRIRAGASQSAPVGDSRPSEIGDGRRAHQGHGFLELVNKQS